MAFATRAYKSVPDTMKGLKAAMCGEATLTRTYRAKTGDGTLNPVNLDTVGATAQSWTLVCTYKGTGGASYTNATFSVTGSVAGALTTYTLSSGNYLVPGQVSFNIVQGGTEFEVGDRITFATNSSGNIVAGSIVYDAVISGGVTLTQVSALPGARNGEFTVECTGEEEFTISGVEYELPTNVSITEPIKAYAGRHYRKGLRNTQSNPFSRLDVTDQVATTDNIAQMWTLLCTSTSGTTATFSIVGTMAGNVGNITTSNNGGTPASPGTPASFNRTTSGSKVTFSLWDAKQFDSSATTSYYIVGDKFEFWVDQNGYSGGNPRVLATAVSPVGSVITFDKFEFVLSRLSRPEIGDKFVVTTKNHSPSITPTTKTLAGTFSPVTVSSGNPGSITGAAADPTTLEDSWLATYVASRGCFEVVGTATGYAGDAYPTQQFDFGYGFRFTVSSAVYTDGMYFSFNTVRATKDELLVINLYPTNQAETWTAECTAVTSGQPTFKLTGSISGVTTTTLTPTTALPAGNPYSGSLFAHDNGIVAVQISKQDTLPGGDLRFAVGDKFTFTTDVTTVKAWECLADSDIHLSNLPLSNVRSFFYERATNESGVTLGSPLTPSPSAPKQRQIVLHSDGGTGTENINISLEAMNYTPSGFTCLALRMFYGVFDRSLPVYSQVRASDKVTIPLMREAGAGSPSAGLGDSYTVKFDNRITFFRYQMEKVGGGGTIQHGGAGYLLPLGTGAEVPFPAAVFGTDNATSQDPITTGSVANNRALSWGYAFQPAGGGGVKSAVICNANGVDERVNFAALVAVPWEASWRSVIGNKNAAQVWEKRGAYQTDFIGIGFSPFCEMSASKEPIKVSGAIGGAKVLRPIEVRSGGLKAPEYAKGTIGVVPHCFHVGSLGIDPWSTLIPADGYAHITMSPPGDETAVNASYSYSLLRLS